MDIARFKEHLQEHEIHYATPDSDGFASLQECVTGLHEERQPGIIARPKTVEGVCTIVKYCSSHDQPVTVRSGGHDMFGRFAEAGVVTIDVRDLKQIFVSEDKKTARIGGGATAIQILEVLKPEGLQIPTGGCGTIGYTGWSTLAGIGPYTHTYGLGTDLIVGAKLVNVEGDLVEANNEMLKGLRGGGGNLGVVVELTIKVFPLTETQAGFILYDSPDIKTTVTSFLKNYNELVAKHGKLPSELAVEPGVWAVPGMGVILMVVFIWNGPACEASQTWQREVENLMPVMPVIPGFDVSVKTTSVLDFSLMSHEKMIPKSVTGRCESVSVKDYSPAVIEKLAEVSANIPSDCSAGLNIHVIRNEGPSFSDNVPESVCPCREPQIVLEILGVGNTEESARKAAEWAKNSRKSLSALDDALEKSFLPLTPPDVVDVERIYGDQLHELRALKSKYDPKGLFRFAIPRLDG